MNDYSDLIFLVAALVVFGFLVTAANRAMVLNNQKLTGSEMEYGAISAAQDVIEKARWMKYSKVRASELEPDDTGDNYEINVEVGPPPEGCPSSYSCKKVDVHVTSPYLENSDASKREITVSLIKTEY